MNLYDLCHGEFWKPEILFMCWKIDFVCTDVPLRSLSMTNLSRLSDLPNKPINIVYLQSGEGNTPPSSSVSGSNPPPPVNHSYRVSNSSNGWGGGKGDYAFAETYHTLPTGRSQAQNHNEQRDIKLQQQYHQQVQYTVPDQGGPSSDQFSSQQLYHSPSPSRVGPGVDEDFDTDDIASQLNSIRLKLEEKRKRIEREKTKMETIVTKQQAKLGKTAYLKALNKVSTRQK